MSSLPVPVSPRMSTGEGILATVSTWSRTCIRPRPLPIIASSSRLLRVTGRQGLVSPESFSPTSEGSIRSKLRVNSKKCIQRMRSCICAPACRRYTHELAKDHGEMALIRKAETVRNIRNGQRGFLEQALGLFNSYLKYVPVG